MSSRTRANVASGCAFLAVITAGLIWRNDPPPVTHMLLSTNLCAVSMHER